MKNKKRNRKSSTHSWALRLIAVVMAFTLAFSFSGFISLAEDLGEDNTDAAATTVEVQEAEAAAEAAAAEQAEAEEAATAEQAEAPAKEALPEEAVEEKAAAEEPAEVDTEEPAEEEEETEAESETEEWDGYFTNEHPEWGGVMVIDIEGVYPCTIKLTISENAFTDPINASASVAMYTTETIGEERLNAILAAADVDPEETDIYDMYMVDLSFTNEDGDIVEPASAVKVKVDTSEEPVDIGAGDVEAELSAGIYHYNEEIPAADKVSDNVAFDEDNKITGIKFSSEWFSPFFVLVTAEPGIQTLAAGDVYSVSNGQVIDGYGSFTVTDQQTEAEYTVTIKDVPTNTPVSLSYGDIEIIDKDGEPVDATLVGRLYYVPDDADVESTDDWVAVSYLQLNGNEETDTDTIEEDDGSTTTIIYYAVDAYDENSEVFDLTVGSLWLKNTTIISAKAEIMPIQTNTLCALEDDEYTQTMIGAIEMSSNPQTYYYPGYEDDYVELIRLTNGKDYTFYYGTLGEEADEYGYKNISNLKECQYAQIVKSETTNDDGETIYEYNLYPLDENYKVVEDTNLYMVFDEVYSFDVEYESMVNEHTEDNGDVYLWMGTQYYVDKYHNQGTTASNYTNTVPASNMSSAGVWVQLGALREPLINKGTAFSAYASVTKDQLETEGVTSEIANAVSANYNYGIAGPYTVAEGATDVETYTARVTGHIGDEFVASDVFDTEVVYMVTDKSDLHEEDWIDLGAHASDEGTRAWWYWINDFYRLNNYEDELEFLEIAEREDETTGETQVRLEADEMGASGLGEEYDVWNTDLVIKRDSVVETDLMTNQEKYTADGVGFSSIAGLPHHVQLRMNGTFETVDEQTGEKYFGELTVLSDVDPDTGELGDKAPYIEYSIPAIYSDGSSAGTVTGNSKIAMENEQEATSLAFTDANGTNVYVPQEDMFDADKVVISVRINFTGTITSSSGETITYTEDDPYTYEGTLTAAQLKEAYDTCPNNAGYDFAVNLSEAVSNDINTDTEIILYKVWDDNNNAYDSRGDVEGVVVTLERSKDGTTWETVLNDMEDPNSGAKEFTILPPLLDGDSEERDFDANQWSLVLTSDDLDLTYVEGDDQGYYEFRIASENFSNGEETTEGFTYNTIITGTSVTNTLLDDTKNISGEKLWEDADGTPLAEEDIPTESVILALYQNGHYISRQTVDNDNNWTFSFTNLPKWNGNEEYVYTLGEMNEDGTSVEEGQSFLIEQDWFHIELTENEDGTYTFANVKNPENEKDVDADGDGEYGDNGMGVKVGDTVTYEIEYTNYFPQEATVIITDVVDEGLDFVEASDDGVYDEETRTITWTLESVEAKTSGTVTFSGIVNETALVRNEIDNTASVQVDNDEAVDTNTVYNPIPDKNVDADGDEVYEDSGMLTEVGKTLVYKIDYENPDDEAATVTITDEVDIGLDFVSATDGGSYDTDERLITWEIEDVEPHTNGSVYFTATVNENATVLGYVKNTAVVQVGNHAEQETKTVYNPVPGKGVDTDDDEEYDDNGESLQVGDTLTYEILYFNGYDEKLDEEGEVITATVTITDVLDDGLTYVSSDPEATVSTNDEGKTVLTWVIEDVDPHTGGSVTFTATVNENALVENVVDNTATVQVGDDPDTAVETNETHNPVPDKNVDADGDEIYEDSGMLTEVGKTLVYKIDYENPDDEAATVTITDEVDEGLDFVEATDNGSYDKDTRTITWVIENVEPHTNGSVYFTATVNENATVVGYVENTAVVQVGNHAAQETKTVYNPVPGKGVDTDDDEKYDDNGESLQVGDSLTYEILYFNGYDEKLDEKGEVITATVTITDVLDVGLTYESSDPEATVSTNEEGKTVLTWVIEDVEPQTGGSVTFKATVNETALVRNEVDNTANVSIQVGDDPATTVDTNTVYNPVPDKDVDANGDGVFEDSGMEVQVGEDLVYKIDYENPDDEAATVTITDVLDIGLDYVESTDNGSYDEDTRTITWVIEDVEAHTNGSVYFTATVNEDARIKNEVENTAIVQVGNHAEQQTKTVYNPIPGKDVDANADGHYGDSGLGVQVGDTLTYIINYFNGDEEYSATVTITDVLDEGLDFVSADNGGTYDEETRTVTWVISDVAAQTGGSVTFTAIVNENALVENVVENTAIVQVGDDPSTAVETNPVYNPVPDKDVDADGDGEYGDSGLQVKVGDDLTYIIWYENPDDEAATVTITDELDIGLDFVSASDGGAYDEDTRVITWVIEDVAPHTAGSVTFTATVNENATIKSYVDNTAIVKVGNHPKQQTKTVYNPVPNKDVDVDVNDTWGDSGEDVHVGDTLTYTINYFNGYDVEEEVYIFDVLDDALHYESSYPEATVVDVDEEGHTYLEWDIEHVEAHTGGSVTFTATVTEDALHEDEIPNTAYVQIRTFGVWTNEVDNPVPDKDVDADQDGNFGDSGLGVQVGDTLTYEIEYFNGYDEAKDIIITDTLDEGLDYVEGSAGEFATYDESTRTITWVLEGVPGQTGDAVTFEAIVNENAQIKYEVENTAYVQVGDDPAVETNTVYNPVPDKDEDIHGDGTYGDSGLTVNVGDTITYIIYYQNSDDVEATVTITDVLDIGLDFVSASDDGTYDEGTRAITWVMEDVAPHSEEGYYVTFEATVNETALEKSMVENTATVQVGDHPAQDTRTVWNPLEPEKDVDADADGHYGDDGMGVQVGDTLTYVISYFNGNEEPATVTITDTLDEGLTYVKDSASDGGTYDEDSRTITWILEDVEAQTGGEVTFTATVNENALERNVVDNTATVQIGSDEAQETNKVENPVEPEPEPTSDEEPTTPKKYVDADGDDDFQDNGQNPSGSGTAVSPAKTADEAPVGPIAGLMLAALAMMLAAITYRKRRVSK